MRTFRLRRCTSNRDAWTIILMLDDGERVLVAHKVWMTRYGVATPVNTTNL